MVIVMLKGGLGNQLFQFGAGLRLARGDVKKIKFHVGQLGHRKFRFAEIFPAEALPEILSDYEFQELLKRGEGKLIHDVGNNPYTNQVLLDVDIDLGRQDIFLDGYYQTGRHLQQIVNFVERLNGIDACPIMKVQQTYSADELSVHIRLGDYRKKATMQKAQSQMALGKRVVIYSDEPAEAKKIFASAEIEASNELDDLAVFRKFLLTERLLIPNSTFSLCAAYLSNRLNTLIRPARWTRKITSDELLYGFRGQVRTVANAFFSITAA